MTATVTTDFLLRATEAAWELGAKLGVRQDSEGGGAALFYIDGDAGELLSEHATTEEAEKAKVFLVLQAVMELWSAATEPQPAAEADDRRGSEPVQQPIEA